MTALWCDGFEGYTDLTQKYVVLSAYTGGNKATLDSSAGRYGTGGVVFNTGSAPSRGYLAIGVPDSSLLVAGLAWYGTAPSPLTTSTFANDYIISFNSTSYYASPQVALSVLNDGTLVVHNSSAILAQSTNKLLMDNWYYIELKSTFASSGAFEVHVTLGNEESVWIAGTGNTNNNSTGIANKVIVQSLCNSIVDDYYILDGLGPYNNNFLGDSRILSLLPASDGTYHQWTPSSGSTHYSLIDEVPPSTLDYVMATSGSSLVDTYFLTTQDSTLREAHFIQQCLYASSDSSSGSLAPTYYSLGSLYYNPAITLAITPAYYYSIWERRPNTGTAWTGNALNQNELGVKA